MNMALLFLISKHSPFINEEIFELKSCEIFRFPKICPLGFPEVVDLIKAPCCSNSGGALNLSMSHHRSMGSWGLNLHKKSFFLTPSGYISKRLNVLHKNFIYFCMRNGDHTFQKRTRRPEPGRKKI